jgi:hypothetical protein
MHVAGFLMRILFVCTGNVDRSKTAEEMFKNTKDVEAMHACVVIWFGIWASHILVGG